MENRNFGDRVYVYGSHDEAEGERYCTGDYVCWSAPADDLTNWTFEGVIFKKSDDPNYETEVDLLAPDAICGPDGRYYLYYFTSKWTSLVWQCAPHRLVIMSIMEMYVFRTEEYLLQNQDTD